MPFKEKSETNRTFRTTFGFRARIMELFRMDSDRNYLSQVISQFSIVSFRENRKIPLRIIPQYDTCPGEDSFIRFCLGSRKVIGERYLLLYKARASLSSRRSASEVRGKWMSVFNATLRNGSEERLGWKKEINDRRVTVRTMILRDRVNLCLRTRGRGSPHGPSQIGEPRRFRLCFRFRGVERTERNKSRIYARTYVRARMCIYVQRTHVR